MRPMMPGAYMNTPGGLGTANPTRRRLDFSQAVGGGAKSATATTPAAGTTTSGNGPPEIASGMLPATQVRDDVPLIVKAARVINQTLQTDESYPDLDSYCRRKCPTSRFLWTECLA
jgi:nuclear pore complex protein Nup155